MKTFIIVVETAFIAFFVGGIIGMEGAKLQARLAEESSEEATPA